MKYVDIPGSLTARRRWAHQAWPPQAVTSPMTCPSCGTQITPQPIAYGYPSTELADAAQRGEVFLGGCVVYRDFPSHRCTSCGIGLGSIGSL